MSDDQRAKEKAEKKKRENFWENVKMFSGAFLMIAIWVWIAFQI